MRSLALLALLAGTLTACGGGGESGVINHVIDGQATVRPAAGTWVPATAGPVTFATGTAIEAAVEGATLDVSTGDGGRAEIRMGPGARLTRKAINAFDLAVGTVTVRTIGIADRMLLYHTGTYAEAGRAAPGDATFTATAVGAQFAIEVERGTVQLNATGATQMELHFVTLGANEQGVAEKGGKPKRLHADDAGAGPFLTPRVTLAAEARGATEPLRLAVSISAGESGAFHGLLDGPDGPASLTLLATAQGSEQAIALRPAHVREGGVYPAVVTVKGRADCVVPFDVPDHGLAPGAWKLRVRYLSYREHSDGPEWLGVAESAVERVTIPD